jgi:hypothetical protein
MTKLDEIALNIELVLISIIEAVALTFLAESAVHVLHQPDPMRYIPYVFAGLAILLVFWSQAILHAISFVRWPLRMEHMLLYFVAVFLQVVAYSDIDNLAGWFFWWTLFSVLAFIIYVVDLRIIRDVGSKFSSLPHGSEFMAEIESRHIYEMKFLMPIALAFNIIALLLATLHPGLFVNAWLYGALGIVQLAFSIGALFDCVKNFRGRSVMIASLMH